MQESVPKPLAALWMLGVRLLCRLRLLELSEGRQMSLSLEGLLLTRKNMRLGTGKQQQQPGQLSRRLLPELSPAVLRWLSQGQLVLQWPKMASLHRQRGLRIPGQRRRTVPLSLW